MEATKSFKWTNNSLREKVFPRDDEDRQAKQTNKYQINKQNDF